MLGAVVLLLASCSDELTVYHDQLTDSITVENDEAVLQQNVSFSQAGAMDIFGSGNSISTVSKGDSSNGPAGDFPLTQVAQVEPPEYQGTILASTHVYVSNDYAYISYNTAGETHLGAVDIIRISNPRNPRLTSRLIYLNADINALVYDDGYLYIAGGVDASASVEALENSFVGKIAVVDGKFEIAAGIIYGFQAGQNATDLLIDDNKVLVTSGAAGVLSVYDKHTLATLDAIPFNDLRSLAHGGTGYAVLDAGQGVTILDQNLNTNLQIPISTDLGIASKKTIDYGNNKIVVPEAYKGAGVYDAHTGNLLEYIEIPTNPVLENPGDKTTNAVGLNEDVLLMANGGAGLCLSKEQPDGAYGLVGILELEGSMNYLATKDDYIIAASGTSGVHVVKMNRPSPSLKNRCKELPKYEGSSKLVVLVGESLAFSGAKRLNNINVSGALLLCGSWTVINAVVIRDSGLFEMNGQMTIGRNSRRRDLKVEANATLRIEGEMNIFGDLVLEDGATLEFIGEANVMNIMGEVERGDNVTITGSFVDAKKKF